MKFRLFPMGWFGFGLILLSAFWECVFALEYMWFTDSFAKIIVVVGGIVLGIFVFFSIIYGPDFD